MTQLAFMCSSDNFSLCAVPIVFRDACAFVIKHHRHHIPPQGWKFGIAAMWGDRMVGVCMLGRPVARKLDDGLTLEITRLCTDSSVKNTASFLLGRAQRAVFAMGYRRLITYILASERGTSLRASGFIEVGRVTGRSWSVPSRPRTDKHPVTDKLRFEALNKEMKGLQSIDTSKYQKECIHG